ncbi:MAG TPA: hypothetical protein VFI17_07515 [Solirubrobacterales bacterium]|nr:hypothetical protein [Solirubrobacterales bacterium]
MADGLILEFEGYGLDEYERVNGKLGIDMASGEGDWPQGLLFHSAGGKDGGFVVYEVWASQADQQRFMEERLGQALREGGIDGPPARVEWLNLASARNLGL